MMDKIIIQIYEVQEPLEAEKLIDAGVDHIGSVLVSEKNWKQPGLLDTMRVVCDSHSKSSLIPLFGSRDSIFRVLEYYQPDIVHFCEDLTEAEGAPGRIQGFVVLQRQIKERFPEIQIMRSIPIPEPGKEDGFSVMKLAEIFESVSDFLLTDTHLGVEQGAVSEQQPVSGFVGITGRICDWEKAGELARKSRIPVILAGGLSPDNVAQGIIQVRPAGVDSCTGTNEIDSQGNPVRFKKDLNRVRRFVKEVRRLESKNRARKQRSAATVSP
jgi:phosphoribosylanthranilate isomerase